MGTIRVIEPGMLTTVQDLGRVGYTANGICRSGAADPLSFRRGNALVGNPHNTPALEMTLIGSTLLFESDAVVALTGGMTPGFESDRTVRISAGSQVRIGPFAANARRYLCIRGGIRVPSVLGSASTHLSAQFGGFHGRPLRTGDVFEFGDSDFSLTSQPGASQSPPPTEPRTVRAIDGAHRSKFDDAAADTFWNSTFSVSNQSNRVGLRLDGPMISSRVTGRLISEGMPPGAVQVPENGKPIVLGVDHPTTGGYPVIACVATADLHILGQARPGDTLRFAHVTLDEARQALRDRNAGFDQGATGS